MNNFTPMTIWSLLGIPPPNPYPKGTRVWYNMSSGGLMFATVDSTGRLPDGTILLTIIDDDGERVTLPDLARYFRGRLRSLHSPSVPRPAPPPWLEPEAQASVERVINMLEEAFKSSYTTTWDVRDYAADLSPRQSGSNEELEKKLLARFPPIYETAGSDIPYLDQPCHITDWQGHILLWYFPEMFSEQLRVL
ncbi:uncharacterized protein LACBIDRAFT_336000 [Laccaria bicolor S238N-H82]|uniref:Predicted protein n=1 Tax=Laccaria bicolor (strain S238N-H82 / ATCC MYA-4686) TaxID=486041 RepID=B0E441_LACBS|nr:uncharacterized protein LACBIDRAFT_336000 [Laccaria bicolor S238N-H82]EDQ98391.1 predicted protein [Laccaria bicolor S238N-H82]|eukprot:XP_001890959.1 predicted protein [Laccaria bicolor S238N-H82]